MSSVGSVSSVSSVCVCVYNMMYMYVCIYMHMCAKVEENLFYLQLLQRAVGLHDLFQLARWPDLEGQHRLVLAFDLDVDVLARVLFRI